MKGLFGFLVFAGYGLPAWVYFRSGLFVVGVACVLLAAIWFLYFQLELSTYPTAGLILGMGANAFATWLHPHPNMLILGGLSILSAWDLARFQRRLSLASPGDDVADIVRRHIWRLLAFMISSGLLSMGAMWFPLKLGFGVGVVLFVIVFVGLVQMTRKLLLVGRDSG